MAFDRFSVSRVDLGEISTRVRHGGSGPPLLLLHGCPQTHMMWGQIAGELARDFTVIAPDIRGYGDCDKPPNTLDNALYSKRTMAKDAIALMDHFGFPQFNLAGHDRGGRVAYRLAMDHPTRVRRLSVLDIIPTGEVWARPTAVLMRGYWHWSFLALPAPQPEQVIEAVGGDTFFLKRPLDWLDKPFVDRDAYADYARCNADPETIRGICEDYRAGARIDRKIDDERGTTKIACPVQVLWGAKGFVGRAYDPLEVWAGWADDLCGEGLDCGHFIPEERPAETLAAFRRFFLTGN